jgi:hypothetical protein
VVLKGKWSSLTTILLRRCPARHSSDFKRCAGDFKRHRKVIVDDLFGYRPVVTGAAREVLNASVAYESLEESIQRYTVWLSVDVWPRHKGAPVGRNGLNLSESQASALGGCRWHT